MRLVLTRREEARRDMAGSAGLGSTRQDQIWLGRAPQPRPDRAEPGVIGPGAAESGTVRLDTAGGAGQFGA